jgi:hypothetical protein
MYINEYSLFSRSGEEIQISELNLNSSDDYSWVKDNQVIREFIPIIPEEVINEAKEGLVDNIWKHLKADPLGRMVRFRGSRCFLCDECSSFGKGCDIPSPLYKLPVLNECFEYSSPNKIEREFLSLVIRHLKQNRRFVVVI